MILLIDHDDSFVFTLARYVAELGQEATVVRAAETSAAAIAVQRPRRIILSPGPGAPDDWPATVELVRALGPTVPILGICLGHQCVAAAYGAVVQRTPHPRHGRTSAIEHDGRGVLSGVPSPFTAARYHSLAVAALRWPPHLSVTAVADNADIMGVRHRRHPVEGLQFHPESVLTQWGYRILANFLDVSDAGFGAGADEVPLCFTPCIPAKFEPWRPSR